MNPASSTDSRVSLRARFRSATREAILEAAAELLGAERGTQTRMEDIAAKAGVAVGTVYNYFEDRAALVSALLESRTTTLMAALDASTGPVAAPRRAGAAPAASTAEPFEVQLERFVAAFGAHVDANRYLFDVLIEEERHRGIDARSASRRHTLLGELLERAERLMEKGIRAKALRREDPAMYAAMLIGMVRGVAKSALARRDAFSTEGAAAIVRVFMKGAAR